MATTRSISIFHILSAQFFFYSSSDLTFLIFTMKTNREFTTNENLFYLFGFASDSLFEGICFTILDKIFCFIDVDEFVQFFFTINHTWNFKRTQFKVNFLCNKDCSVARLRLLIGSDLSDQWVQCSAMYTKRIFCDEKHSPKSFLIIKLAKDYNKMQTQRREVLQDTQLSNILN